MCGVEHIEEVKELWKGKRFCKEKEEIQSQQDYSTKLIKERKLYTGLVGEPVTVGPESSRTVKSELQPLCMSVSLLHCLYEKRPKIIILKKHTPSNTGVCTHLNAVIAKVDRLHWKTLFKTLERGKHNHTENLTSLLGSNVVFLLCHFPRLLLLSTNTSFVSHLHLPSLLFSLDYLSFSFFYPIFHLLCGLHWL